MNERNKFEPATANFDVAHAGGTDCEDKSKARPANEEIKPANELTPEEQMALFEKELKESDWGHQPC